ncbi:MAG: GNAT family N-acetyltransferase [Pseudomonadota bacterium]
MTQLSTERLLLRQWQLSDYQPFAELNASPRVMAHFPDTLSREQSDDSARRYTEFIAEHGWGFWATELKETGEFIGFIGINSPAIKLPFSPCIEIGWRLAEQYWGHGYATEGALASLEHAFTKVGTDEVVSMTTTTNHNSEKVMQRISMRNTNENFLYPTMDPAHRLAEHVLYKITREQWLAGKP